MPFVPLQRPAACFTLIVRVTGAPIDSFKNVATTLSLLESASSASRSNASTAAADTSLCFASRFS
ncbi:hypothetical protein PF005_g33078 [Phytophthora fragariae]|uniref:Uncharacterized protein n=1 Tax=Phytophthora fragariae TaxID=53985 RepID=A0A6A4AMG6_9STRA|nr:hypothetical protein PF003_g1175 [Phytophthora fragariae]KAE8916776.1 hypothetical protein PF009_g32901 [Phytophthora fragariae]KAE8951170.1 hypothetical protein PF011_g33037 [Phytophthora fragariae]KAE9054393.1 hypothetical protein PF006_g33266 [Phytophthora fragariae]KAE9054751.1 hypothetical protein PF007_g32537 [Phytophthora fragariae]